MIVKSILCLFFLGFCSQLIYAQNDTLYYSYSNSISNLHQEFICYNIDGFFPNDNILPYSFSNHAWIPQQLSYDENGITQNQYFALSTSQYINGVQSEDWLISKAIQLPNDKNAILSWSAMALSDIAADGYEVRIFTTFPHNSILEDSADLIFSIEAENHRLTNRNVNLNAYRGQRIYIAFVNKSVNKYMLAINNILVKKEADYILQGTKLNDFMPYAQIPFSQYNIEDYSITLYNNGRLNLENIDLEYGVINHRGDTVFQHFQANLIPLLAAGDTIYPIHLGRFIPQEQGVYTFYYKAYNTFASFQDSRTLAIQNTFARCAATFPEKIHSIGTLNNQYAINFTLINREAPQEITALIGAGSTATHITAYIYSTYPDGSPYTLIAQTDTLAINSNISSDYTLNILQPHILLPATYAIAIEQIGGTLNMGFSYDYFNSNTNWFRVDNNINGWRALETLNNAYQLSPMIYLNMSGANCIGMQVQIYENNDTLHTEVRHATHPLRYTWLSGETTSSITNLNNTYYYLTVTDALGCVASNYFTRIGIAENKANTQFKIYPIPSDKYIHISAQWNYTSEKAALIIYNAAGQKILEKHYTQIQTLEDFFDIGSMANGLYFIHLRNDKENLIRKIIKQ